MDNVSPELKSFLDYLKGKKTGKQGEGAEKQTEDPYIQKLEAAVRKAKQNREWRREYMMLWMRDQENAERGIEQGMRRGMKQQRRSTILKMIRQGFSDEQIKNLWGASDEEIAKYRMITKEAKQNN